MNLELIIATLKNRGFIFQGSEIYGGLASSFDFGPLGVELKNNLKKFWWKKNVYSRDDVVGLDSAIFMNPKVWQASGHAEGFFDALVECKKCHKRFRLDHLKDKKCPECKGEITQPKNFNLMFRTYYGPTENSEDLVYLRPETAQGIFINFKNVLGSLRMKLPFGIAQIGKSFRNEISLGPYIFRTREFEQMEIEYFTYPKQAEKDLKKWVDNRMNFFKEIGFNMENLRAREQSKEERAHYSAGTFDIEYKYPFGWQEIEGIANRTDFDLKAHGKLSGQDLQYFDDKTGEKFYPYVIEPSAGVERILLALLFDSFKEEKVKGEKRLVLAIKPFMAPIKAAVLPLVSNKEELVNLAKKIHDDLKGDYFVEFDDTGSIGRRYRRQDEIGTPFCITIDHQSLEDKTVTIRDRDSMKQERVKISELKSLINSKIQQ